MDDSQVDFLSASMSVLLQMAYRLPTDQIVAPAWINDDKFDIHAKLPTGAKRDQAPQMLQAMLAERFKMTSHHEERIRPVYLLKVGKGQPGIKPTAGGDVISCNGGRGGQHTCQNLTMQQFAEFLSRTRASGMMAGPDSIWMDRPVINQTGLAGAFDFELNFGRVGDTAGRRGEASAAGDSVTLVPLAEAVRGLGFQLEASKQPFDFLVIDHLERTPTEN